MILPIGVFMFLAAIAGAFLLQIKDPGFLYNVTLASQPAYSASEVMNGNYQKNWNKWLNDNFFGHTAITKLYNQIQYSVFRSLNGEWEVGKDFTIYNANDAYLYAAGKWAVTSTQDEFENYAKGLSILQEKLQKYGKDFIYILTPAKVEIYPETLSWNDKLLAKAYAGRGNTNRDLLTQALEKYGVHYYDTCPDMKNMRGKGLEFDIYAKTGHHWTLSAVASEINTLFEHMKPFTPHVSYPSVSVSGLTDTLYAVDKDILTIENLFHEELSERYTSPVIHYDVTSDDSVYWFGTSMGTGILDSLAQDEKYRAFKRYIFQEYWVFTIVADDNGRVTYWHDVSDPPAALNIMGHIHDSDLIVMDQLGQQGLAETHTRFLNYLLENIDRLYYVPGEDMMTYTEDSYGVNLVNFYEREDGWRWIDGDDCLITFYADAFSAQANDLLLRINMVSFYGDRTVEVIFNGQTIGNMPISTEALDQALTVPRALVMKGANTIELKVDGELYSCKELGISEDPRYLAAAVASMALEVAE